MSQQDVRLSPTFVFRMPKSALIKIRNMAKTHDKYHFATQTLSFISNSTHISNQDR